VSAIGELLGGLSDDELRELAQRLRPYIGDDDRWMNTRDAAAYAGCSVHALRHAIAEGEVEHEQSCVGGKVWIRRSALDRWRNGGKP
jgi:excisionase family DNA binding protein